jgi:hypothetical protein
MQNSGINENKHENNADLTETLKSIISIYIKPNHEEDSININGIVNTNRNYGCNSLGIIK